MEKRVIGMDLVEAVEADIEILNQVEETSTQEVDEVVIEILRQEDVAVIETTAKASGKREID